jgi:hypothetical protein
LEWNDPDERFKRIAGDMIFLECLMMMNIFISLMFCTALNHAPVMGNGPNCMTIVPDEPPVAGLPFCMIRGEELGSLWLKQHSGWHLEKVRCSIGKKPESNNDI